MADCDLIDDRSHRPTFDTSESDKDLEEPAAAVNPISPNGTRGAIFTNHEKADSDRLYECKFIISLIYSKCFIYDGVYFPTPNS